MSWKRVSDELLPQGGMPAISMCWVPWSLKMLRLLGHSQHQLLVVALVVVVEVGVAGVAVQAAVGPLRASQKALPLQQLQPLQPQCVPAVVTTCRPRHRQKARHQHLAGQGSLSWFPCPAWMRMPYCHATQP